MPFWSLVLAHDSRGSIAGNLDRTTNGGALANRLFSLMAIAGCGRPTKDSIRGQQLWGSVKECRDLERVSEAWPCG
jgi:hypothetical protein